MTSVKNQRITVAGLGHFGGNIAVCRWLVEQGAGRIVVTDQADEKMLADSIQQLAGLPMEFHLGVRQSEKDFVETDLVIASPAIPPMDRFLQAAVAAKVPITTEICLFVERCAAPIIAVTGTKGKSTTTALLSRMLGEKHTVWTGGNIGKSLLADVGAIKPGDLVVLELSSYMLHYLGQREWSPHGAVLTMLSADHLDWHGGEAAYLDAKKNIVRFQSPGDFVAFNEADAVARRMVEGCVSRLVPFALGGQRFKLMIGGEHNQLNAQAAFAAAAQLGISWELAQHAVGDFAGLPHRLQLVHEREGVRYINDSIATIPDAAIAALNAFPAGIVIQIVGGSKKKDPPIEAFAAALRQRAKAVLCIGETGEKMAGALAGFSAVFRCGDLATAVAKANILAQSGDVVLLSPGYASYDQFTHFQQRGERFIALCRGDSN